MDIKKIKSLADILNEKGLSSLELEEGDSRIKMEKNVNTGFFNENTQVTARKTFIEEVQEAKAQPEYKEEISFNNMKEIKSPMVGVFYAAPSPESAPFVKIGDKVKKGEVICVIEAMKLMNDITSDYDGEIIDICVSNGDVVEFSQTLFKIV